MGTHPIFESDFDCLTALEIRHNDQPQGYLAERVTCSLRTSARREPSDSRPTSPATAREISLISRAMVPSKKVCPIRFITEPPDVLSTSPDVLLVSSSTNSTTAVSFLNVLTSESST